MKYLCEIKYSNGTKECKILSLKELNDLLDSDLEVETKILYYVDENTNICYSRY